jgi:hypothetical protein
MSMWTAPSDLDYLGDDGYEPDLDEFSTCPDGCEYCAIPRNQPPAASADDDSEIPF